MQKHFFWDNGLRTHRSLLGTTGPLSGPFYLDPNLLTYCQSLNCSRCLFKYFFIPSVTSIFKVLAIFKLLKFFIYCDDISIAPSSWNVIICLSNRASYSGDNNMPLSGSSLSSSDESFQGTMWLAISTSSMSLFVTAHLRPNFLS